MELDHIVDDWHGSELKVLVKFDFLENLCINWLGIKESINRVLLPVTIGHNVEIEGNFIDSLRCLGLSWSKLRHRCTLGTDWLCMKRFFSSLNRFCFLNFYMIY